MANWDKVFSDALSNFTTGVTIGQRQARIKEQKRLRELKEQERLDEQKRKADEAAAKSRKDLRETLLKRSFTAAENIKKQEELQAKQAQQEDLKNQKLTEKSDATEKKPYIKEYNRQLLSELQSGLSKSGFDAFSSRKVPVYRTFSNTTQQTTDTPQEDTSNLSDEEKSQKIFESLGSEDKKPAKGPKTRSISKMQIGDKFLEDAVTKAIKSGKINDTTELSANDAFDILLRGSTKDLSEADVAKGRELAQKIHETVSQNIRNKTGLTGANLKSQPLKTFIEKKSQQEPFDSRVLINTNLAEEAFMQNPELSKRPLTPHASGVLTTLKERQALPSDVLDPILAVADNMSRASSKQGLMSVYKRLVNELLHSGQQAEAQAVNDLIDELDKGG